jgi:hypothetical protein
MNTHIVRASMTLSLVLVSVQAIAIPNLRRVEPNFSQSGNSTLNAGVVIEADTDLAILGVGGGFTITCSTSSLQQTAERFQTYNDIFGPHVVLLVPPVVPSSYSIPAWTSIPAGTCNAQCVMQYNGEARDETSLAFSIGGGGAGANFSLIPDGEASLGNSVLIGICRGGRPQCCTPGCQLP